MSKERQEIRWRLLSLSIYFCSGPVENPFIRDIKNGFWEIPRYSLQMIICRRLPAIVRPLQIEVISSLQKYHFSNEVSFSLSLCMLLHTRTTRIRSIYCLTNSLVVA